MSLNEFFKKQLLSFKEWLEARKLQDAKSSRNFHLLLKQGMAKRIGISDNEYAVIYHLLMPSLDEMESLIIAGRGTKAFKTNEFIGNKIINFDDNAHRLYLRIKKYHVEGMGEFFKLKLEKVFDFNDSSNTNNKIISIANQESTVRYCESEELEFKIYDLLSKSGLLKEPLKSDLYSY